MKITKLMLSAAVAALALVSCNKQDTTPTTNRLKTVEISIDNAVITKGLAGDKISQGDAVQVNDFKVFLTDAAGKVEFEAKVADGSAAAQTYWDENDLKAGSLAAQFHYVDPNCTKVIAIANVGKDITFDEFLALEALKVEAQQDQKTLVLYDEETLQSAGTQHNDLNVDGTTYVADVYKADLVLTPRVSRFEVDGFTVKFDGEKPKYQEIKISQLAFQNYYPLTSATTGAESGELVNHIADLTKQAEVYAWLDDPAKPEVWYRDYFDITITPAAPTADTPNELAYHMFSCNETPVLVIKLLADGQPAYLYSKGFFKMEGENAVEVTEFEEGKIYRMSAAGEVLGDGSIPIDEEDIDPMDRCLEITVDVIDWAVELVFPEF
ncbi:MAG: hypothetical protein IJB05_01055 [Bacteroidales bacterium]|nr:hypothetical protein [Bacteroidales bacterium]